MTDTIDMIHEDNLPGDEHKLDPQPEFMPRYPGSGRLKGKVAVVTGADSGIGRAVAVLFAREGADVAIAYLCEHEDAAKTQKLVEQEGARALVFAGDLGDKAVCQDLIDRTVGAFGGLDIIVNNAGEQHPDKAIEDITEEQLKRTFQTNIYSMFFVVQAAMPHLREGAAIVNCTSVTMYQGSKELLDYSSTKGAITAFTRSLSENLIDKGIRVNAVAPGPIWTPLNPFGGASKEKLAHFGESTPMGRPGQPNEVAPCFLFLACEDSSYMSGQVLHPNGGMVVGS
ncbi:MULTISPECIES: SDR family oxidoreductase [Sphingobium]|uniref:SDR family oxidoreductase n=1 Tax=Sphingobium TaxID=165695 RepID=UPI0015ECAD23|nr:MULTISPECIES: SDR family oxidoreductase [Sphingobium]MCW2362158.1 NAD(P)-dependent dehydrogenase (short-subunit alcohol dehydrogenase family) [Sphingobium sp. B10D3B]MCW2401163.1 NAD(P)-dependent dehydrogenase (short-subunit alcohol dehydrogenase family) [Sphingobium sp. B10D7B]MCW2408143.1 NAD(P)-dependent dehydrogenase (short-subunit alcohol dehydrogenase family) [Sphingobium xanthum]